MGLSSQSLPTFIGNQILDLALRINTLLLLLSIELFKQVYKERFIHDTVNRHILC